MSGELNGPVITLHTSGLDALDVIRIPLTSATVDKLTVDVVHEHILGLLKDLHIDRDFRLGIGNRRVWPDIDGKKPISYFEPLGANWFLHVPPAVQVIETVAGKKLTLQEVGSSTVTAVAKMLKRKMDAEEGIPQPKQKKPAFAGQQLLDLRALCDFNIRKKRKVDERPWNERPWRVPYNIQPESTLHLVLRLRGGSGGMEFVDMSNPKGPKKEEWVDKAPDWRVVAPGLTLEGKCRNRKCAAYNQWVCINMGMTEYNTLHDNHKSKCPECSTYVPTKDCGFSDCRYRFFGLKLNPKTGHLERAQCDWKTITDSDCYQSFSSDDLGVCHWHSLVIQTNTYPAGDLWIPWCTPSSSACCFCLDLLMKEECGAVCTLKCGHQFLQRCGREWMEKKGTCPTCNAGAVEE
ncbi:uncharacterized protein EV422DRAFT_159757 [Fimicolochytrium jonesii]|uniref:uncharacterized protein n=1 Tax=Fimicolochytrium jonesii TaxID=1396493 RepID=UPI0022FED915|nr:uncharacterized protein EV422DRAFT_159757 [Fimicolochytrium jonesii]KAI8826251.1 hypothetical protein EV422DRAFT_159757 [Fimicolochytrium jonesii]